MSMMSEFRRSTKTESANRGGKGGKGNFRDKFYLRKGSPTPLLLIGGEYVDPAPAQELIQIDPTTGQPLPVKTPYYKGKKHRRKMLMNGREEFRDEVCSAGPDRHNPQPCAGCMAMDQGDKTVTLSDFYAFGMVHLVPYHGHPVFDRQTGQMVMKKDNSGFFEAHSECEGRTCNFCRVLSGQQPIIQGNEPWPYVDPRTLSTKFGHRRYIEIGKNHLQNLGGIDQAVTSTCGACRNELTSVSFNCPFCQQPVIDMSNDPRTDEQIMEAVAKPYPCLRCQRPVLLTEVVRCDYCQSQGRQATNLTLFDAVLWLMKQGENTASQIMMGRPAQMIEEFEQQLPANIRGLLQGKSLRTLITEIGQAYDFAEVYKPRSLQDQAKRLELNIGGQGQGYAGPQYGAYGQPQQQFAGPMGAQAYGQQGAYAMPQQGQFPAPPMGQPQYGQQAPQQGGFQQQYQQSAPQQGWAQPNGGAPQQPQQAQPQPMPVPFGRPNFGQ